MNTVNSMYSNITVCDSNTEVYGKLRCGKNTLKFAIREMTEVTDDRIAGVSVFSSRPQRPMTSDFEGSIYKILSITLSSYFNS